MNLTEIKIPKLTCPACERPIVNATQTRSGVGAPFRKGTVFICGQCSVVLKVGDSNLERMSANEVNALSRDAKAAIASTKLAIIRILEKQKKSG